MGSRVALNAETVARSAHGSSLNKHDGEPYIHHVERVVAHLARLGADEVTLAVAWLHDVVEDTHVTLDEIRLHFGDEVAAAVDAITHRRNEPRVDYYERVGRNRTALMVKMADGGDNTDPARKANLDPATRERLDRKYAIQARHLLAWALHYHMKEN